jgi:hypothetical protein
MAAWLVACDLDYPEVVVVNRAADPILLKNPSLSGCVWNVVLANGIATSPGRCLPGSERIHFQKMDAGTYCRPQGADVQDEGLTSSVPVWFNYQTRTTKDLDYGQFYLFELTPDDMEQDFSVPGPYGHGH